MPEDRPAVVFDINVLINAVVGDDSDFPYLAQVPPTTSNADADCLSIAFDADDFGVFVSPHIMENVARILGGAGLSATTIEAYVDAILDVVETSGAEVLDPPRKVFDVADHEDNLILDFAVACEATIVVSNDTDLTSISRWHNRVAVMRPRDFVGRTLQLRRGRRR